MKRRELFAMLASELKALARKMSVALSSRAKKAEIVDALLKASQMGTTRVADEMPPLKKGAGAVKTGLRERALAEKPIAVAASAPGGSKATPPEPKDPPIAQGRTKPQRVISTHSGIATFSPRGRSTSSLATTSASCPSPTKGTEAADELKWWNQVKGIAEPTITFWVNWLREDDQNACPEMLVCIIRAISWVESRHGHGAGTSAARDPMQVGNPNDTAWQNIGTNASNAPGDRPIRQGNLPGVSWKNIPADVNAIINPTPPPNPPVLPYTINPTFLPANGHNSTEFTKEMSYFWGIIWYFYSLQVATALGAWRLGNCDPANLIGGAVQYNGGGDPNYEKRIKDALKMVCCSSRFNL